MESAEIRLRIVEALAPGHSAIAVNDPVRFTQAVAEIERFVIASASTQAEPEQAVPTPAPVRLTKKKDKPDPDFLA